MDIHIKNKRNNYIFSGKYVFTDTSIEKCVDTLTK